MRSTSPNPNQPQTLNLSIKPQTLPPTTTLHILNHFNHLHPNNQSLTPQQPTNQSPISLRPPNRTPDETDGGIILTKKAKKKSTTGTVVACGPGKTHPDSGHLISVGVLPGEKVIYGEFDGTEVDYQGSKHTLIRDDDVLVKFNGEKITKENVGMTADKMLVRVETKEQETTGGLLIAPTSQKGSRPSVGEVVAVGPGRPAMNGEPIEMDVVKGDMVKFRDFAGNEVQIGEEDFSVIRMQECLAKY